MTANQNRAQFRETVFDRDNHTCTIPWCDEDAVDAHHIIERELWNDGGYIPSNGAAVCEKHHKYAETNDIPPQSFWMWTRENTDTNTNAHGTSNDDGPVLPASMNTWQINKWGDEFDTPPWEQHRDNIKYQSSRHLLPLYWQNKHTTETDHVTNDDTGLTSLEPFVGIPLVITHKIDGGNCMLVNDVDNPVRARNGSRPEQNGTMKPLYNEGGLYWTQQVNQKLPDWLQVFGEWVYAKHSIHYGCDCDTPCEDIGPSLSELTGVNDDRAYFQVFGVFDTRWNTWLSWPATERVADTIGFPTTPVIYREDDTDQATFETEREARHELYEYAKQVIADGGEGIVVRSKFPYHYGQFEHRLGKYVRENHVKDGETHWSKRSVITNNITS